ncbi:MAG: T9SS type A sorting domain-containing protein [Bacteroidetes bacterium]|nr:MAG: T9SS type A sorting domain-containing protein [Bacteroidota bacterium]
MKTIFKILLVISLFTNFIPNAKAADTLNPCWTMYKPHDPDHNSFNPDSVMWDTCVTGDHKVLYAYKWYYVILPVGALNVPWAPGDSLIYRDWRDIDSSFTELRNGFQLIENKFGPFIMKKQYPDEIDTSSIGSRSWYIKFEEYFNIDSIVYYLGGFIDPRYVSYDMRAYRLADNVNDTNAILKPLIINLYPNPSDGYIIVDFYDNKYGLHEIEIYNEINNKVYQYSFINSNDNIMINLNLSFLPNGLYFLKNGSIIKKFIILK